MTITTCRDAAHQLKPRSSKIVIRQKCGQTSGRVRVKTEIGQ